MREATQEDVGKACVFVDPVGKPRDALITAVWGPKCTNVTFVDDDPNQQDSYGRKLVRSYTSCMHGSVQEAHGNYWLWPGETRPAA